MSRFLRMLLAVVVGFVLGSVVNMALVMLGGKVVSPPAGADVATMEGLKASIHLFEPRHFLFPFLAHALGTLVGAAVACGLAPGRPPGPAYIVGGLFLMGGVANAVMLPAPAWFNAADLLLAYLPMAWLGRALVRRVAGGGAGRGA
ncbi:hypothetical protein [Ideonella sp. A 288]|uniref:hypothetical protein n=1 Tax=Ideonella sp. A 288 TaxID=1962181 RepID=UPI000B4A6D82|nr:hypothetical protein [Ideonella sp. A 288]